MLCFPFNYLIGPFLELASSRAIQKLSEVNSGSPTPTDVGIVGFEILGGALNKKFSKIYIYIFSNIPCQQFDVDFFVSTNTSWNNPVMFDSVKEKH